ncbi:hypothetical protein SAMN05216199_0186 [Pedococcus cremeus]|uniref:Uncharacterized protein n=1 Tax=Pedococcus cremeus TaxID=587636 RepID=A0A1H9XRI8_9MICO|nr:hypothetical protein [Pedococcus cremeus]SES48752.1 hypothetical protein SAMN05216199_0186 [Pedococcus cremeus]
MPEIAVSADDLVRLGDELEEVRAFLAALGRVTGVEPWAFGPGDTGGAVTDVLGNWERYRLLLARRLESLGLAAHTAGAGYVEVEARVADAMGGPLR